MRLLFYGLVILFSLNTPTNAGIEEPETYAVIQQLFTITPSKVKAEQHFSIKANEIHDHDLVLCVQGLLKIFRLLDNVYPELDQEVCDRAIEDWKAREIGLWGEGALKTLYKEGLKCRNFNYFNLVNADEIIFTLLGQILNHMDGGKREFSIDLRNASELDPGILNVMAELVFHKNNNWFPLFSLDYNKVLIKLIAANPSKITAETREQILQRIKTPEVLLYDLTDGVHSNYLFYVLQHPGQNLDVLESFMVDEMQSIDSITAYLAEPSANPNLVAAILAGAFRFYETFKLQIYQAYMARADKKDELIDLYGIAKFVKHYS